MFFGSEIFGADGCCSLEHHVFQKMRCPAFTLGFIDGPHSVANVQGYGRAQGSLNQKNPKPVTEFCLNYVVLQRETESIQGKHDQNRADRNELKSR